MIWIFGFVFECVADYQKSVFNSKPKNKGKFIKSGVWSVSRHPNYVG
jgi:steroid 5-alpha reductase family enzyme